jgi:hypothetical protein
MMTKEEKQILGKILSRLLTAVDSLDEETTFRNISYTERAELNEMIGRLCGKPVVEQG